MYTNYERVLWPVLDEYFSFLLERDLGFLDNSPSFFPDLDLTWKMPCEISNCILDIDPKNKTIDYHDLILQLSDLNCQCIQMRVLAEMDKSFIAPLLEFTKQSRIRDIRLLLKYNEKLDIFFRSRAIVEHKRISQIIFYGAESTMSEEILGVGFLYIQDSNWNSSKCGNICRNTFNINVQQFTESLKYNSCLNGKIGIDEDGNIKNCPSQISGFGNVANQSLKSVIQEESFKKLWKVKKDDVKICQDCEFRYICTDCRMFTEDQKDIFSKPSKCGYDPYTNSWN